MQAINDELLEKVPKKIKPWLTLPRILIYGFLVVLPATSISVGYAIQGAKACSQELDHRIKVGAAEAVDSVNSAWYKQIKRLQMLSMKTNVYLEVLMSNEETRHVAESRWHHDSLMIDNEFSR